jgi:hypothetical protein
LKNIDFTKFLENRNENISYSTSDFSHQLTFCEPTYIGNSKGETGITKSIDIPKVCGFNI